jgi:hypothetical protein
MRHRAPISIEERLEQIPLVPTAQLHGPTRLPLLAIKEPPQTKLKITAGERLGETVVRSCFDGSQKRSAAKERYARLDATPSVHPTRG